MISIEKNKKKETTRVIVRIVFVINDMYASIWLHIDVDQDDT